MELNFQIDLNIKLTAKGVEKAMKIHGDKEDLVKSLKEGLKELILNELNPDINSGMMSVDVNVYDHVYDHSDKEENLGGAAG